ncbi:MAG: hypothetical protein U0V54_06490 [Saprospiraceae bacterium]|nr:hypothetical protein [Saprospiraceae bacterium]
MNLVLQSIAIVFFVVGVLMLLITKNQPSFNEFSSKTFIGLVSLASAAVLSIISGIFFLSPKNQLNIQQYYAIDDFDYDKISGNNTLILRRSYKTLYPSDETDFTYIGAEELIKSINEYRENEKVPDDSEIMVGITSITYDSIFAKQYLEHIFKKYPSTKKNFISYYTKRGYPFDETTDVRELAKALHNRNSHKITLSNNQTAYAEHYDMGRLCPPNCPD